MACVLITDALIIKALEDQESKDFEALWSILKAGTVRGYITPNDLQQLDQYLHESVGEDFAQKLLSGFRSVLGIYGEPDHPIVDLIIDDQSMDELEDEIPIRSVSDFLCIYELELLLAASPGEELNADSLFSSLSEIIEILDGEDAFVSRSLMDVVVPVDDAPILENTTNLALKVSSAAASDTRGDDAGDDAGGADDYALNQLSEQTDEKSAIPPLSPVMQAILNTGNPTGRIKHGLRFGSERLNDPDPFNQPTRLHQSVYDVNVDMFLILGLIMQMAHKDDDKVDQPSNAQALLIHKIVFPANHSDNEGKTAPSTSFSLVSLSTPLEDTPQLIESVLTDFDSSKQHQAETSLDKHDGDRSFKLSGLMDNLEPSKDDGSKQASKTTSLDANDVPAPDVNSRTVVMAEEADPNLAHQSTQISPPLALSGESSSHLQSANQTTEAPFAKVTQSSDIQMGPVLRQENQTLVSPITASRIAQRVRLRSDGTVSHSFPNSLKNTLKLLKARKQAIGDRLTKSFQITNKQSSLSPDLPNGNGKEIALTSANAAVPANSMTLLAPEQAPSETVSGYADTISSSGSSVRWEQFLWTRGEYIFYGYDGADEIEAEDSFGVIAAEAKDDVIDVYGGSQTIHTGTGRDWITAVDGTHTLYGGKGDDIIDVIDGTNSYANGGNGRDDIYVSGEGHTIEGGNHADYIFVFNGEHQIDAGSGHDTVVVYEGNSTVTGGRGEDLFILHREKEPGGDENSQDLHHLVITDFEQERDAIMLFDADVDGLNVEQVGVNTHIFDGDDLLVVLESVDRNNFIPIEIWFEEPYFGISTSSIMLYQESSEPFQEFALADRSATKEVGAGSANADAALSAQELFPDTTFVSNYSGFNGAHG
ncbi:MAG: calcium-binding protein [Cyanobacteria bacterium P01_F01_bin.150]